MASRDAQSHLRDLQSLFTLLSHHGITINRQKSRFGHHVTSRGVLPLADRVAAIKDVPPPDSKVALQRYLGMVNYY